MAQVIIEMGKAMTPGRHGAAPTYDPNPQAEELASSGTSAASTITAMAADVCTVYAAGDVWVAFGASPVAAVEQSCFVASGHRRDFGPMGAGFKAAVIDDS